MEQDMGASPDGDRATGLRPQPATPSSQSSVPSADLFRTPPVTELPAPARGFDLRTEFLKERYKLADEWVWHSFEVLDYPAMQFTKFQGGVYPYAKAKGKYKGRTDYKRPAHGSESTVILSEREFEPWLLEWERRTGKCWKCTGSGEVFASWSAASGTTYKPCRRCEASGKEPASAMSARSAETEGLSPKDASAVGEAETPNTDGQP